MPARSCLSSPARQPRAKGSRTCSTPSSTTSRPEPGARPRASQASDITLDADPKGPLAALVFKTVADPYVGKLSYFRVYSGTLKSDSHVFDTQQQHDERIGQLYVVRGKEQIAVNEVPAGDIGAVAKLQTVATGDTLCDQQQVSDARRHSLPRAGVLGRRSSEDQGRSGQDGQPRFNDCSKKTRRSTSAVTRRRARRSSPGWANRTSRSGLERMARKFGVNVDTGLPTVAYRETISQPVKGVEYKHKKQTGGHGQYGHVFLDVEPMEDGDFEFADRIVGGVVPKGYIPAVEKGVREALDEGILAGFPVTHIRVTLTDGSYHTVDSSEMAFKIAASQAFKKGASAAKPIILEPIMHIEVTVPEAYMGDVMSDLNGKRAQVQGMKPRDDGMTTIEAIAPAAEIQRYATDLRSITQGRGSFTSSFSHYQPVPAHLTDTIIANAKAKAEAQAGV